MAPNFSSSRSWDLHRVITHCQDVIHNVKLWKNISWHFVTFTSIYIYMLMLKSHTSLLFIGIWITSCTSTHIKVDLQSKGRMSLWSWNVVLFPCRFFVLRLFIYKISICFPNFNVSLLTYSLFIKTTTKSNLPKILLYFRECYVNFIIRCKSIIQNKVPQVWVSVRIGVLKWSSICHAVWFSYRILCASLNVRHEFDNDLVR